MATTRYKGDIMELQDIHKALNNGKVLENITGGLVWLEDGKQKSIGAGRSRHGKTYGFSTPSAWYISKLRRPTGSSVFENPWRDTILPIVVGIMALLLVLVHTYMVPRDTIDSLVDENSELFQEVSQANHEVSDLTKELNSFKATAQSLEELGASPQQAKEIIVASGTYGVDPLILGSLCKTESDFTQSCTHALPYVIGAFGISIKDHRDLPASPYTFLGNAKCSAFILKQNLDKYHGNYKKALTAYKGICTLGRHRADEVLEVKRDIK